MTRAQKKDLFGYMAGLGIFATLIFWPVGAIILAVGVIGCLYYEDKE